MAGLYSTLVFAVQDTIDIHLLLSITKESTPSNNLTLASSTLKGISLPHHNLVRANH